MIGGVSSWQVSALVHFKICSGFTHLGCGQHGFEILQNPHKDSIESMGGHNKIWYVYAFTILAPKVNMVKTFPFTLAIFPDMCWYL